MKPGVVVTSAFLATLIVLAPVILSSSTAGSEFLQRSSPVPPPALVGYVYEPDGVTPVVDCLVNVTNKNTGVWVLTTTDPVYGVYVLDTFDFGYIFVPGQVYNVTATKGSQIGWNEMVVANYDILLWIDVVLSPPKVSFELSLVPGWNVISLPLIGTGAMASTLGLSYGDFVIGRFNTTTQVHDEFYAVGMSPAFKDFPLRPGLGYYVHVRAAEVLSITGWVPTTRQSIDIVVPPYGGWALLGFASLKPRHASEVPGTLTGGRADIVIGFTEAYQVYHSYVPVLPFTDFVIYPGHGFWVHLNASATWAYDP
jgi:hypothetical protein